MNRIYNSWIFIISVLTLLYAFFVMVYETFGIYVKVYHIVDYKEIVYTISAILLLLIGGWRSMKKWSGIRIVNQISKFQLNFSISQERKKHVRLNNNIEIIAFSLFCFAFYKFDTSAYFISLLFLAFILDSIINSFVGLRMGKYRIGVTKKAIVYVDREVKAIYFKGLKRITKQKDVIYFEYINDLVLDLSLIALEEEKREELFKVIRENSDESRVYFSGFEEKKELV